MFHHEVSIRVELASLNLDVALHREAGLSNVRNEKRAQHKQSYFFATNPHVVAIG
jgi:hypothetical protein